jgi:hypothetical protein
MRSQSHLKAKAEIRKQKTEIRPKQGTSQPNVRGKPAKGDRGWMGAVSGSQGKTFFVRLLSVVRNSRV